jgi:hypothetical protein
MNTTKGYAVQTKELVDEFNRKFEKNYSLSVADPDYGTDEISHGHIYWREMEEEIGTLGSHIYSLR